MTSAWWYRVCDAPKSDRRPRASSFRSSSEYERSGGRVDRRRGVGAIRVPYGQTVHGEEEIAAVVDVLRTSTQMGVHVREFETRVAALFAKTHGIMVNSGSSANYLAVQLTRASGRGRR